MMTFKKLPVKTLFAASALLTLSAGVANAQTATADATAGQQSAAATETAQADATQADGATAGGAVQAATKADIKAGVAVVDQTGAQVGKVESVTDAGAVVSTGTARVQIPFESFGKSDKGLVIAMSKTQLEAAAKGS